MSTYYTLLTAAGAAALTSAYALGTSINLTHLAVGDGGGSFVAPVENMVALTRENHRVLISAIGVDDQHPNWLIIEAVIPASVGGFTVREIGLFDENNTLIAVGNFPPTDKPLLSEGAGRELLVRMFVETSNAAQVTLAVDPSAVVATSLSISNAVVAHEIAPDPHPQYLTPTEANSVYAPINNPVFTGDPKAPTASPGDSDTSIANTAFVTAAIAAAKTSPTQLYFMGQL